MQTAQVIFYNDRPAEAQARIARWLCDGHPAIVPFSAGKDSSVVLSLTLAAAIQVKADGHPLPPIAVTHAQTQIDNPECRLHADATLADIKRFAARHGLPVTVHVVEPNLNERWPVRIIGGRGLPTFPNAKYRDCTVMLKIDPQKRLQKQLKARLGNDPDRLPVILLGTRFEESAERARRMKDRGDNATSLREQGGFLYASPIADWDLEDVWTWLATARERDDFSSFEETMRLYAAAGDSSCSVVGDLKMSRKPCSSRHGCAICTAVTADGSMQNMLAHDERYAYMRHLNRLQRFIVNTQYDYIGRRAWFGRSVDADGYVKVGPDAYAPQMLEDLLKYALTIDAEEREAAEALGIEPRFQIVDIESLVAIDAMWSAHAFHRPFHALWIFRQIVAGVRWPVPEVPVAPECKVPPSRYHKVSCETDWAVYKHSLRCGAGFGHVMLAAVAEASPCMSHTIDANGRVLIDCNEAPQMTVDLEGASLMLDLELDHLIDRFHDNPAAPWTAGYRYYVSMGILSVNRAQRGTMDRILARAEYKAAHDLAGPGVDYQALYAQALSQKPTAAPLACATARVPATPASQIPLF